MKAILIDDEKPALQHLERLLARDGRLQITGKYTSGKMGLQHLQQEKADIVFLDIGMPEMNGLEAAEHIMGVDRSIRIVYITAYTDYAIDAFELNAVDYLLKPVTAQRLNKTLERLVGREEPAEEASVSPAAEDNPYIRSFKRLEFMDQNDPGRKTQWRTSKAQEVFALMLHYHGQWILKDMIVDLVWPDFQPEKAVTNLHTTVYHIRKLLKTWGMDVVVEFSQERYRLVLGKVALDVEQFVRGWLGGPVESEQEWERREAVLALYRGDYLGEHPYDWAETKRKELRAKYLQMALRSAEYELGSQRPQQALTRLTALQEVDPYSEDICRLVLRSYADLGDFLGFRNHYENYKTLLQSELGIHPGSIMDNWVQKVF
ncbi:Protein-glutamate methylesterase/protein-glutamine glutaminase [Paenibacillus auburnensis]|uniref:Protein-glutamate methylesterase/protein-glutamine glutaminase n=1 Tax=Paenibacillus auburnensis TaxID=2905649 RepID=A0ABN8GLC5_9BACL|nr:response regulator [Paenibacillus auburnensis]CAH1210451.1 Protein-glutamate methylesterase/protein-glutamine glutaminase [Paenibacillus auburnensis]